MIAPAWSDALTGLAGKNNATQANAWAKFPLPFGPKPHLNPTDSWAEFPWPFGPKPYLNPRGSWAKLWYTYGVAKASEDTPSGQVGVFDIRHLSSALAICYLLFVKRFAQSECDRSKSSDWRSCTFACFMPRLRELSPARSRCRSDLIQRVSIPDRYVNRPARVHRSGHYWVHLLCGVWFLCLRASGDPPFAARTSCQCRKRSAQDVRTRDACADDTLCRPFVRLCHAAASGARYGEHRSLDGGARFLCCACLHLDFQCPN